MGYVSLCARDGSKLARLAGAVFLLLTVGACGSSPGIPLVPIVSPPTDALIAWQAFPADRVPRPIVLLDELPRSPGFSSNDAKIAMVCHRFGPPAQPLPSEVPVSAIASWPDGTRATFAAISAKDAYAAMSVPPTNGPDAQCNTVPPVTATAVRLGQYGFNTDRGTALMSAWLFTVPDGLGELAYPAISQSAFWGKVTTIGLFGGGTTVSADGLVLNFAFYGAPSGSGPCDANYTAVVAESTSAVAVATQMIPSQAQSGLVACPAIAHSRSVKVTLAHPLGGRVLVDASGSVVAVCPANALPASADPGSPRC